MASLSSAAQSYLIQSKEKGEIFFTVQNMKLFFSWMICILIECSASLFRHTARYSMPLHQLLWNYILHAAKILFWECLQVISSLSCLPSSSSSSFQVQAEGFIYDIIKCGISITQSILRETYFRIFTHTNGHIKRNPDYDHMYSLLY